MDGADARARPVVGMTTYLQRVQTGVWDVNASFLPAAYIEGINRGGGAVVLLPPQPDGGQIVERILDGLDGLVITGGRDVDPARYGRPRHPSTDEPVGHRDEWDFALVRAALRRGLPLLGICRGAQVLNVALGGTLHQHLPDVLGHTRHRRGNAAFSTSSVQTVPGTRLATLIGDHADVQCYHHQAIDRLGDGLVVGARDTAEGVVEAIERDRALPGDAFVLAVQWHPEERLDDVRLFGGLVEAAGSYATERVS